MQIPPSTSLLQALSAQPRPAAPNAAVPKPDAARAAARAAFQGVQQSKPTPEAATPKPVAPLPPSAPDHAKIRPRGSVINITV